MSYDLTPLSAATRRIVGDSPCTKDCPDRCAGCGAACEKYKAWRKAYRDIRDKLVAEQKKEDSAYLCRKYSAIATLEWKRRKGSR